MQMRHLKSIYVQVLIAIALGAFVGAVWPQVGVSLKPLGDGFIKLVKLTIAPVIFCTVAGGIARMNGLRTLGRIGGKAILYFEVVSTLALVLGIGVALIVQPGRGFNIDPASLDQNVAAGFVAKAAHGDSFADYVLRLIPDSFFGPLGSGEILQTLVVAVLTGIACTRLGPAGDRTAEVLERIGRVFFSIIHVVVRLAPLGAFGAMGFTIGKYGIDSLVQLGALVATFYLTSILFVLVVLGVVARLVGFSILKFLGYIREELLVVLGTSSSETVLPQIMEKLERLGASKPVVGLVVPAGYSFNLDGTNIYMTLSTLFLAQATNTHLTVMQIATLLVVAMLTSKGATGVTGAGFITLAATLAVVPSIPVAALAVLVGVDRFMSECRALTNLCGNGVATLAIAAWEKQLSTATRSNANSSQGPGSIEDDDLATPHP